MIDIRNREYYDQTVEAAKAAGIYPALQSRLGYLATYACQDDAEKTRCELYQDFAPLSFAFVMKKRDEATGEYKPWMNGGLIYHDHDKSWGVHT